MAGSGVQAVRSGLQISTLSGVWPGSVPVVALLEPK